MRIASQRLSGTGTGGTATVLTLGTDDAVEQLRTVLGLGCSAAVLIEADPAGFGPADVAREIAAVVTEHAAQGRSHDLVLLGNDAADTGDFQVGIRLAYALGRPVVNGASMVVVAGDTQRRTSPDRTASRPTRCRCPPSSPCWRAASSRATRRSGRMKAKKVKVETVAPQREPDGSGRVRLLLPPAQPSAVEVLGEGPDAAKAVVDLLQKLGVARCILVFVETAATGGVRGVAETVDVRAHRRRAHGRAGARGDHRGTVRTAWSTSSAPTASARSITPPATRVTAYWRRGVGGGRARQRRRPPTPTSCSLPAPRVAWRWRPTWPRGWTCRWPRTSSASRTTRGPKRSPAAGHPPGRGRLGARGDGPARAPRRANGRRATPSWQIYEPGAPVSATAAGSSPPRSRKSTRTWWRAWSRPSRPRRTCRAPRSRRRGSSWRGRGAGSADGFDATAELAELLGGALGGSRVVTSLGWRPHHEQIGQTGSRIAPDLYIPCGISGAIQHWAGCSSSKTILAFKHRRERADGDEGELRGDR